MSLLFIRNKVLQVESEIILICLAIDLLLIDLIFIHCFIDVIYCDLPAIIIKKNINNDENNNDIIIFIIIIVVVVVRFYYYYY